MNQGHDRWVVGLLAIALFSGCSQAGNASIAHVAQVSNIAELASHFDPDSTGTIHGKVIWDGPTPEVPPFLARPSPDSQPDMPAYGPRVNPHRPRVNSGNHGVGDAVVFLRQVDLQASRPWDHEAVRVEQADWKMWIAQGKAVSQAGFVRRGEAFSAMSKQKVLHILRGEGAAFFSLPFPDQGVASSKTLDRIGQVELTSGADYCWMRAHLFVDEHPYYTRTDADGRFSLAQVPPGSYQLVCWLPDWRITEADRNPESCQVGRVCFHAPLELPRTVVVPARGQVMADFVVSLKSFGQ